jgi:hypothetical protein
MAKTKAARSETSTEALLERIQELETRLSTVEAGLEAEAALFAVSPPRQGGSLENGQVNGQMNGPAAGRGLELVGASAGLTNGRSGTSGAVQDDSAPGGFLSAGALLSEGSGLSGLDGDEQDSDDAEGVDPEAVSEAAARRKQPDSPIPFTPGDLRSRLGKPGGVMFTGAARLPRNVRAAWQRELAMVDLLDADWAPQAEPIAALAHPVRLALLREVLKGARSVSALASLPGLGTSGQLYHHLKPLLAEGWLQPAGRGRYEVPNDRVLPLLGIIAAVRRP